ncbi:uncharacterized protein LOC111350961 isoform X3 [Spodoptera litura]|nr:uncharacterized protein LOC111350961 isoform X3 [Spodoptera litura]
MRSFIIIAVLSALAACYDCAVINNEVVTTKGTAREGDVIFFEKTYYVPAEPFSIQRLDVAYYGNSTTYINQIRIIEPRLNPIGSVTSSALGKTFMQLRISSVVGGFLHLTVQILGYYTDSP